MNRSILKTTFVFFIFFASLSSMGQVISSQSVTEKTTPQGDQIFIYKTIQNISLRHESAEAVQYEWFEHNPTDNSWTTPLQSQNGVSTTLVINKAGGYGLKITNNLNEENFYRCWAFAPSIDQANIELEEEDCFILSLRATYNSTPLVYYKALTGEADTIPYETTYSWSTLPAFENIDHNQQITIASPVEDTKFEVTIAPFGETQELGVKVELNYTALAVEAAYKAEEIKTEVEQEIHTGLGSGREILEGSAPIEIRFTDESKGHITAWEWKFTGSKITKSDRNPFHLFTAVGVKDSVMLTVRNQISGCESTVDNPVVIHAFESLLEAPNTFTPNGDGLNDEFRVVYRSIKKYKIVILNRWGRKVYESNNPAEGWDGTIGNSHAAPGVYFYSIEAEGYIKEEKYSLQGPIHLIRGK